MGGDVNSNERICQNLWTTHIHSSILQLMNKQTFLNLFHESATNARVQQLATAVDALDRIQENYLNKAWWLNAWYFIPNMFWMRNQAKHLQRAVLQQNAQKQIAEQVNLISQVVTEGRIDHNRLLRRVMDCIMEAFTLVIASKSEGKELVLLTPTWFEWGDFVDSLAEKFPGITVQITQDQVRSRRIAVTPSVENTSHSPSGSGRSSMILNAAPMANKDVNQDQSNGSRRNSLTLRAGFKAVI
jgi:hypothetical protein